MAEPQTSVRTAVVGVGGYAGAELARLLLAHPRLQDTPPLFLGRDSDSPIPLEQIHPQLALGAGRQLPPMVPMSWEAFTNHGTEVVFLATPHESSRQWVPELLARGMKVIDLSGAWRLHHDTHRAVYKLDDINPIAAAQIQKEAVYGCPELHAPAIARARLVANPGCYATSIILALAPILRANLVDLNHGIIADSKSGVSGAGKAATAKTHFMYAADNLSAYALFGHRHTGELLEQLSLTEAQIQFTPHLLPIPRGILSTIYLRYTSPTTAKAIQQILEDFYAQSPMVRVRKPGDLPQIQHVAHTSYCDIGFQLAPDSKRLILISCLDNLLKGASGQAVQNLNLLCGWNEAEGLR